MKRHPSLVPLSHDHHDALVVAQGLILGRSKAPRSNWPTDRLAQVDRVVDFFKNTLLAHFDAEDAYVFPVVMERMPDRAALIAELRHDHEQLRNLISDLERAPATDLDTRLPALGRLVEAHIRKEERVLFQAMQSELDAAELDHIGAKLTARGRARENCRIG